MEFLIYKIALVLHLFSAIIFVGYLFFDIVIYPNVKKLGREIEQKVANAIARRAGKIMPFCLLLLFISGVFMFVQYFDFNLSVESMESLESQKVVESVESVESIKSQIFLNFSTFQKLLILKAFLAFCIFLMVIISLSCAFIFKCKNPLAKIIHPLALILSIFIVIIAKFMF